MDNTLTTTTETAPQHTTVDAHHGPTGLMGDTTFYVLISFIIFGLMAYKFGRTSVASGLDTKIARIRDELAAAQQARIEAEQLLAEAKVREKQAGAETTRILEQARADAASLLDNAALDLDADMLRREAMLTARLQRMKDEAKSDLQSYAASLVMQSTEQIIVEAISEKTHAQLVKATTDSLPDTLKKAKAA